MKPGGATAGARAGPGSGGRPARAREIALAAFLALAAALPFVTKAVHQDDWAYLAVGSHLVEDPGSVWERTTLYMGRPIAAAEGVLHGPVWLAVLGAAQLAGEEAGVLLAHVAAAGMLALLAASACSLAARLGAPPLPTALALALSPVALVLAGTVMTDLPMVALFCAALALAARGVESGSVAALLGAGVFATAAALTRYHGLAVAPLLAVFPFLWGRFRWRGLLPFAVVALLGGGFLVATKLLRGQADSTRAVHSLLAAAVDREGCLLAFACTLGGVAAAWALGGASAPLRLARAVARRGLWALVLAGAALGAYFALRAEEAHRLGLPDHMPWNRWQQAAFFVAGGLVLTAALRPWLALVARALGARGGGLAAWRDAFGREAVVALWLVGFAVAAWGTVPFGCSRYALPALPPAFLLAGAFAGRHLPARVPWIAAAASAAIGLGAAEADWRAAEVNREIASLARERLAPGGAWAEGRTWIWGELGFRYYLEREAGLEPIPTRSDEPRPGDRLLKSAVCTPSPDDGSSGSYRLHPRVVRSIRPGWTRAYRDDFPVRVHQAVARAGFYHADAGYLPYAFLLGSATAVDELQVWDVVAPNRFFETFLDAERVELATVHPAGVEPRIRVERMVTAPGAAALNAIGFLFPGRATWRGVPIDGEGARLSVRVGEHVRVHAYDEEDGPGALARVLVDGEVVAERALDARRIEADRGWQALEVDLSRWAGREVAIGFEARAQPPPAGVEPALAEYVYVGFAEPEIVP